jgi:two-component system CheB/CheR fusion protein
LWVPGCSSGEETYSLAIALLEFLGEEAGNIQIQIFATDLSEAIIQKARAGVFSENIAADVSSERLRRFFQRVDGNYQIKKSIRDICVFAKQDLTRDPPFSRLDLICCRNVMIYMGQVLQKRILPLFHYALNPDGLLFLGSSETVGQFGELFSPVDKKHKLYVKRSVPMTFNLDFVSHFAAEEPLPRVALEPPQHSGSTDLQRITEQILLNRYAPAGVVVNDKLDILQFVGRAGPFLEPAAGDATLSLMKMVKPGLHGELRAAFQKARRDGAVRKDNILIEQGGGLRTVSFEIMPLKNLPVSGRHYLLIFEEQEQKTPSGERQNVVKRGKKEPSSTRVQSLEEELEATREYLQSIIEEQRTTNEELRSANEEIQSSNEELQSINEELETAKEELQSTNEELTTVNEELQNRNDELTHLNNDLNNLLSSVNIPIIMLGSDLRIRRFTPMAEKVMNLIPSDAGRPFTDIKPNINVPDLKRMITHVIDSLEIAEVEVQDSAGRLYALRIRPYRTADNRIDGVVMVLLDRMKTEAGGPAPDGHEARPD